METGTAELQTRGTRVRAGAGQWLICLPGERSQRISGNASYASLHFTTESPADAAAWSGPGAIRFEAAPALEKALKKLRDSPIITSMREAGVLHPHEFPLTFVEHLSLQHLSLAFFGELAALLEENSISFRHLSIPDIRVRLSHDRLNQIDFRKPFSRKDLARRHGLSASQMDRLWRRTLGFTPQACYEQRRLRLACTLLEAPDRPIKEVSHETGFRHFSRFCIWFKTRMGCSPGFFRRQAHREH